MKKPIITAWAICLCTIFFSSYAFSQSVATDSTSIATNTEKSVISYFNTAIGEQSRIYNGREFTPYSVIIKGNPNFRDQADFMIGVVKYDGFVYPDMYLIYDIYGDQLIARYYNKFSKYILDNSRVASFDLGGHHFVYIDADTVGRGLKSGYYDELYNGKTRILARYSKSIQNTTSGTDIETYFTKTSTTYLVKNKGTYVEAGSKGELLSLLKDRKKELQQFINSNGINFKDLATALPMVAAYYDHLTP